MTDIYDALARGFRYPGRPDDDYDEYSGCDDPRDEEIPRVPLALDPAQRASLARAIQVGLDERGCDNTPRAAQAWARREKVRWRWLRDELEERGGFCDCEVLMNVLGPPPE